MRRRAFLLLLTMLVLHISLFSGLRLFAVAPELALITAVTAGLTGRSEQGAVTGFLVGLSIDLYLPTPFGLSAICYTVCAYASGLLQSRLIRTARRGYIGATVLVSTGGVLLFATLGRLLGRDEMYSLRLFTIMGVTALYSLVLAPPLLGVWRWVWKAEHSSDGFSPRVPRNRPSRVLY